jgi:hypothetical protein
VVFKIKFVLQNRQLSLAAKRYKPFKNDIKMRKILLLISMTLSSFISFGQYLGDNYYLNFEDSMDLHHVTVDTISNPNNIWQIGTPQKTIFSNASSIPNAIITDTINTYQSNDTSIFIITNIVDGLGFDYPHTVILSGKYFVNSDTLTDFGTIEFSPDNGNTWLDLINDTLPIIWQSPIPILTGTSNGWLDFYVNIAKLGPIYNIQMFDTTLYRFTFISDSIQTNKDGLMFDDFEFVDYAEGLEEIHNNDIITIYPNPVENQLSIKINEINFKKTIQIINSQGEVIYDNKNFQNNYIDTKNLDNGLYFLKYSDTRALSIKKFVVSH